MSETLPERCQCDCGKPGCVSRRRQRLHGLDATYVAGCRCEECRRVHGERTNDQKKQVNRTTLDKATRWGLQWTSAELEIATRADLTAQEAAIRLGRSFRAVKAVRHKCRTDPKYIALLGAPRL